MKILSILGSPRKNGNSSTMANEFVKKAEANGAVSESFILNDLNYKACQGCNACKMVSDKCVINDDLTEVLDKMQEADVILFSSPVYVGDVTGQFKTFLDRASSYLMHDENKAIKSRLKENKSAVFMLTQGADESMFSELETKYEMLSQYFNFKSADVIRGGNLGPADGIKNREDILEKVRILADKLTA